MYQILLVEDDSGIREIISDYFNEKGGGQIKLHTAKDGYEGLHFIQRMEFDLVLLDIMMPKVDGYHVLQELRKGSNIPVMILSAKDADSEKILGLNLGADDYMAKPFNPLELVARVKSQLKRYTFISSHKAVDKNEININGLQINKEAHVVKIYDKEVKLTPIEFEILYLPKATSLAFVA